MTDRDEVVVGARRNTCNVEVEKYEGSVELLPDDEWPQRIPFEEEA